MQERELKDEVVKLLKQYVRQRKPVRIIFGDLESDCVIIEGLEVGLDSEGRYLLGLDLWIAEPTRKTIFVASPLISIFVEDFEIIYESWFLQYKLKYLEVNNVYRLSITSGEYEVVIDERKEDEK
jgi:hypothetical protein